MSNTSGGVRVWSKETGLGPVGVGLRGFKSRPPHHIALTLFSAHFHEKSMKSMLLKDGLEKLEVKSDKKQKCVWITPIVKNSDKSFGWRNSCEGRVNRWKKGVSNTWRL